jgi:hypothetical protein
LGFFDLFKSKRGAQIRDFGYQIGYGYSAIDEYGLINLLRDFQLFKKGIGRRIKHLLTKEFPDSGLKVYLFDYQYTVSTGKTSVTYYQTVFYTSTKDMGLPRFYLKPENLLHTIGSWLGKNDIDFDDFPDFSKSYYLTGEDEYLIRRTFTEQVIKFFEKNPGWSVEGLNYFMIFYQERKRITPEQMRFFKDKGFEIFELFKGQGYSV